MTERCATCQALEQEIAILRHELAAAGRDVAPVQAEQAAAVVLTGQEREALEALAQDLPAIWHAETTTDRERKQLRRFAITHVDLEGVTQPGQVAIQIHWRSGTITTLQAARPRPGHGSLKHQPRHWRSSGNWRLTRPTPRSLDS